jgi:aryl-alcohol dehydrogenase-like predicted oxidoreductase
VRFRTLDALHVSVVGLGCNQLGTAFCEPATAQRIVGEAVDAGITFFDTADEYGVSYADDSDPRGWGRSEEQLGGAPRGRRDQVVVASQFGVKSREDHTNGDASARWVEAAVEGSLRRLGTDYLDLYQLHFPDPGVPIAQTLSALNDLLREGEVREIGCSNFTPAQLRAAAATAAVNLRPFASTQGTLIQLQGANLADVLPACQELEMAFIPYWPLASGMLTGKYRRDQPLPRSAHLVDQLDAPARARLLSDRNHTRLEAFGQFARERGHTLIELAFALAPRTALGRDCHRRRRAARPSIGQRGGGRLDAERRRGRRGHPAGRRGDRRMRDRASGLCAIGLTTSEPLGRVAGVLAHRSPRDQPCRTSEGNKS